MAETGDGEPLSGLSLLIGEERIGVAVPRGPGVVRSRALSRSSHASEEVSRAADLMIELYGRDAVEQAERIRPPGAEGFAALVLQEVKARLAQ